MHGIRPVAGGADQAYRVLIVAIGKQGKIRGFSGRRPDFTARGSKGIIEAPLHSAP